MGLFKKALGGLAGAALGGAVAGPVGSLAGGVAGASLAAGKVDFSTVAIGGIAGFALSDLDLGTDIFGGGEAGAGTDVSGLGDDIGGVATPGDPGGTGAGEALKSTAGVRETGKGLLSKTLSEGKGLLSNPLVGYTALGIGQSLLAPDPVAVDKARLRNQQRLHAENYRTVAAPSDRRRRAVA